jgi:hypothetical protein
MTTLRADVALSVILFVGTCTYLGVFWPHALYGLDEGMFLYESKRIVDGQVMYRDFFELWGPMGNYALALMYALFGVSMETARGSMAVLHAVIVVLVYAIMRRLGVRPMLAAVLSLTHIALFFPALAFASPHWLSTALTLMVFLCALRAPVLRGGHAVALGVLTALVALTQQPKGVGTAAAVVIVLIRDVWTARHTHRLTSALVRQLGAFAIGLLGVLALILGGFVLVAGFEPVFDALVRMPLGPYRRFTFVKEGRWFLLTLDWALLRRLIVELPPSLIVHVIILNVMPFIIPVSAGRLIWQTVNRVSAEERRPLFVAVVFSALSIISVIYYPASHHFAVVGPIWLILYAESLERLIERAEDLLQTRFVRPLATLTVLALLALALRQTYPGSSYGVPGDTSFGRVQFHSEAEVDEIKALRTTLQAAGAKEVFVYPSAAGVYLMTGTSNPTRYQLLIPGYNTAEQFAEVQETLERERVPFVVRSLSFWGQDDPLLPYLREHYEGVKLPRQYHTLPTLSLFRRKADGGDNSPLHEP